VVTLYQWTRCNVSAELDLHQHRPQISERTLLAVTDCTAQQKEIFFLVPWFLGLFLGLFGPLIQKITLDRPHQL
jgi:hypothetical protein